MIKYNQVSLGGIFDSFNNLSKKSSIVNVTEVLESIGFKYTIFSEDVKNNRKGIYIFTYTFNQSFEAEWISHSESKFNATQIKNLTKLEIAEQLKLEDLYSKKIMYVGSHAKSIRSRVQNNHYEIYLKPKKDEANQNLKSMKTRGLRLEGFRERADYDIQCHLFELENCLEVTEESEDAYLRMVEHMLHSKLKPILGTRK